MTQICLGRRAQLQSYVAPLTSLGFNTEKLFGANGMSRWMSGDGRDWVPAALMSTALETSARATGCDQYGHWIAEQSPLQHVPVIGKLIGHSIDLRDALNTTARIAHFHSTGLRIWVDTDQEDVWLCAHNPYVRTKLIEQYTMARLLQTVRLALGENWVPAKIRTRYEKADHIEKCEPFRAAVNYRGQGHFGISIPKMALSAQLPNENPTLMLIDTDEYLGKPPPDDFVGLLRSVVKSNLEAGALTLDQAAEVAETSSRTLKRWLAKEGMSYRRLVGQARYQAALDLLDDPDIPLKQIAGALGYSDAPNFYHAFYQWAGITPGEYRKENRNYMH